MLKTISLLAILAITISFGVQYADAHQGSDISDGVDEAHLYYSIDNILATSTHDTITLDWRTESRNGNNPPMYLDLSRTPKSCEGGGTFRLNDDGTTSGQCDRHSEPIDSVDPHNGFRISISEQGEFMKSFFIPEKQSERNYTFTASDLTPNTEYTFDFTVYDCDYDKRGGNNNECEPSNGEYHISIEQIKVTTESRTQNNPSSQSSGQRDSQSSEQQSQQSETPEVEYGGQPDKQSESQQSETPEAEYDGQLESKVSEPESITLDVSAFSDSNGNGIQDDDELPLSNLMLLVYTPDTGILDVIYTTDGTISKSDFTSNSFYVIAHPEDGYTSSTHQFLLDDTTVWGVLYVENPQIGSTYDMNVGITQDLQ